MKIYNITTNELDNYLAIASFVDSKLPSPIKHKTATMYDLLPIKYEEMEHNYHNKKTMKIIPNTKQITIYEYVLILLCKIPEKERTILQLRNFPSRRSFRALKRFYLPLSEEAVRLRYITALKFAVKLAKRIKL